MSEYWPNTRRHEEAGTLIWCSIYSAFYASVLHKSMHKFLYFKYNVKWKSWLFFGPDHEIVDRNSEITVDTARRGAEITFYFTVAWKPWWWFLFLLPLGLSAPSVTNPFQNEQPRLTLNQMRPSSTSPAPSSLQYSASLPASNQPLSLPSSFTEPSEGHVTMPGNLPQPLLPLSSTSTQGQPDQSQNPFLWGLAWAELHVAWM